MFLGNYRYNTVHEEIDFFEKHNEGKSLEYRGVVDKLIEKENSVYLYSEKYLITIKKELYQGDIGLKDEIVLHGEIKSFNKARNKGNFDEKSYYNSIGIIAKIEAKSIYVAKKNKNILYSVSDNIKELFVAKLDVLWNDRDKGIIKAMTVGDKELVSDEDEKLYKLAGISHILVVSGIHLSIIGLSIYKLLRKRFKFLISTFISTIVMLLFFAITGGSISVKRALIMYFVGLFARIFGRSYDLISSLSVAFLLLSFSNPMIIYNTGFLISVSAIVGIAMSLLVSEKSIVVVFIIQIFTLPIIMFSYYEISTYSVISNYLALPLVFVLLISAYFSGMVLALTNILWLAKIVAMPAYVVLRVYNIFTNILQKIPYNQIVTGKPDATKITVYYVVLMFLIMIFYYFNKKTIKALSVGFCVLLIVVFVISAKDKGMYISFIDIGQGDCILIHDKEFSYMIDCGSSSQKNIYKYYVSPCIKAHGIAKIDMLFLTHMDDDHINGAYDLLENGMVKCLVMPDIMNIDDKYDNLIKLAKNKNISVLKIKQGDVISDGYIRFSCLNPKENGTGEDVNELSVVLKLDATDFSALFMGDLGSVSEPFVIEQVGSIDLLKVGHHGSKYSSSDIFLEHIKPKLAVIMVGAKNRYNHPNPETLDRLYKYNISVKRTDLLGEIIVRP